MHEPNASDSIVSVWHKRHLYLIFAASGFAALIYQSVWARYLKIFLGNAAYAQALVLIIFMLGIAVGSAIAARYSRGMARPMLAYAAVEAVLAVMAVYFHDVFVSVQDWALDDVLPGIATDAGAQVFKWSLGASLILMQSVLLGMTFPLLAAGMMRRWRDNPGDTISVLYFVNSAGAACGVLVGGFFLVPETGLVGASLTAALINAGVAVSVWWISRRFGELPEVQEFNEQKIQDDVAHTSAPISKSAVNILILTAAITGLSSFIYEVVWIRLISLLLGGSVYSFEIMLAVFIGGLAAGGLMVRRAADRIAEPLALLAKVQIAMGAFALASLVAYPFAFDIYRYVWSQLPRDEFLHVYHWTAGGVLAALLILPTAVCAGMTLPLITRRLLRERGEASLGIVYAANTLGSIVGVFLAVHFLLSQLGAQLAMIIGASFDLLLGFWLFCFLKRRLAVIASAWISAAAVFVGFVFGGIPLRDAAVGVYRHGQKMAEGEKIVFYRDGKTASVSVVRHLSPLSHSIRTNGKSDALIVVDDSSYGSDEMTMTMSGLLPLLIRPDAKRVANIGFGAGLTTRTLLISEQLERLDNIEIEPMMVAGARLLGPKIAPVFEDERNHFIFDDAKSVFARAVHPYQIIISEPSNPWISGIGGLFTREFYRRAKSALASDGVFVQWLPFYESSPRLFASVIGALSEEFSDFRMYLSGASDAVIVAVAEGEVPPFKDDIFQTDAAREFLGKYEYVRASDMEALFIGSKEHMLPYLQSFKAPVNSDYFPYLEHQAPEEFFHKTFYAWGQSHFIPVPFMEMANARTTPASASRMRHSRLGSVTHGALALAAGIDNKDSELRKHIAGLQAQCADDEEGGQYMLSVSNLSARLLPHVSAEHMTKVWDVLADNECIGEKLQGETETAALYTRFWRALSLRDAPEIIFLTDSLASRMNRNDISGQIVLLAALTAHYQQGNYGRVLALLNEIPNVNPEVHHAGRFIGALAAQKI